MGTRSQFRNELNRPRLIHTIRDCVILADLLGHGLWGDLSAFGVVWRFVLLFAFLRWHYKTLKKIYYTYWTFSSLIGLALIGDIVIHWGTLLMWAPSTFALVLLIVEMYWVSSPVFFPIVHWWEYDFRYRSDLKVDVTALGDSVKGRLTDLRRQAGCVVTFQSIPVGDTMGIHANYEGIELELRARIVTRREPLIGRGIMYGVKFLFEDKNSRNHFARFSKLWRLNRRERARLKFKRYHLHEHPPTNP